MSRFLDTLAQRILIYDGAMGTNIQRYQLTAEDYGGPETEGCNEYLVLTKPSVIEEIQGGFFEVGCDVIETNSFTASRLKLDEYGLGHLTHEINFTAAQLARRLADRIQYARAATFRRWLDWSYRDAALLRRSPVEQYHLPATRRNFP